ncbi:DUF1353 domain-containing protein [Desulfuromonas thiophila]|uniref:DUF1353 domain-containing protein n=1 Tax=Desulfuromonas thiophila TaxID=57664 RepID=A0A1G7B0P9_9BACT|nr:DUF1353 domain-containing protein [Desulfuromonas thiophila]SDE20659.1 Protein of unknown function [Desulfuromonas thiophila]
MKRPIILQPQEHLPFRAVGTRLSRLETDGDLVFCHAGKLRRIRAFAGEITDGASIPRLVWSVLGLAPHGVMDTPALFHDLIYRHRGRMPAGVYQVRDGAVWRDCREPIGRGLADALLRGLCEKFRIRQAALVWAGVRVGGWWAWLRDDRGRMERLTAGGQWTATTQHK